MRKLFKLDKRSKPRSDTWRKPELDGREIQVSREDPNRTGSALSGSTAVENPSPFVDPNHAFARVIREDEVKPWPDGGSEPSTQNVTTHEGFGSWLSTFQPEAMSSDEHQKNLERLSKLALTEEHGRGRDTRAGAGGLDQPRQPQPWRELMPAPVRQIAPEVLQDPASHRLSHKAPRDCSIVFEGIQESGKIGNTDISLPPDTPLTSVIQTLQYQGPTPNDFQSNAYTIRVTSGPSNYSFAGGYRINEDESFISFFNASIAKSDPVEILKTADDELSVDGGKLKISFQRSLRIPETGKAYDLPPEIAKFPLFNVKDFAKRMPGNMAAKGGVCMPLFQREAMWIDFNYPGKGGPGELGPQYAIKVFVGGVNAISGEAWNSSTKKKQDYIVVPPQPWLDGIATGPGVVKQFVAMPLGSGYSIEQQVTGKEDIGGIQMEISPVHSNEFEVSAQCRYNYLSSNTGYGYGSPPPSWNNHDTPKMMACTEGMKIFIKDYRHGDNTRGSHSQGIYYDLPVDMAWDNPYMGTGFDGPFVRPAVLRDLLDLSPQEHNLQKPLFVTALNILSIFVEQDGSLDYPPQNIFVVECSPFAMTWQLVQAVEKASLKKYPYTNAEFKVQYDGIDMDEKLTIWEHGIRNGAKVKYCCLSYVQPEISEIYTPYPAGSGLTPSSPSKNNNSSGYYGMPDSGRYSHIPYPPVPQPVLPEQPPNQQPPQAYNPQLLTDYPKSTYYSSPPQQPQNYYPPTQAAQSSYQPTQGSSSSQMNNQNLVPSYAPAPQAYTPQPSASSSGATYYSSPPQPQGCSATQPTQLSSQPTQQPSPSKYVYPTPPQNQMNDQNLNLVPSYAPAPQAYTPQPSASSSGATYYSSPPQPQGCSATQPTQLSSQPTQQPSPSQYVYPTPPQNQMNKQNLVTNYAPAPPTASSGLSSPSYPQSTAPPPPQQQQQQQPRWDMGLAAGGRISQKIHPDPLPKNSYNSNNARVLNIQILNSIAFETCTGMLTPETPITTESYAKAGLPFYRIYEEEGEGVYGFSGDGDGGIKSLGTIDQEVGVSADVKVDPRRPTCNHAFCAECVRGKMTTREGIVCAFCGRVAELLIGISAPMSMPGEEDVALTNVVVLQESRVAEIG
ncbi:unnamed protein product [Tuber aestivum]|uniref:RING-type domain-containing protein n=1 Tax=Tuber aestivum TaxID=59557 RepID=A0A292PUZ5_9PEZI|nr:unnamed protein product [Tuber aestivum]